MSANWYDVTSWDVAGQVGGALGVGLKNAGDFFRETALELAAQSATSAQRAEAYSAMWQQLDTLTINAIADLDALNPGQLEAQVVSRVNAMRSELAKAQSFLSSSYTNASISDQLIALGKNLGAVLGAAEILYELNGDDFSTYAYGQTALGMTGGFLGAAAATFFLGGGLLATGVAAFGLALGGKWIWEKYLAPAIGWSPESSPLFWDAFYDQLGLDGAGISDAANTDFYAGTRARPAPRDPLAIDLDGDGIETVGVVPGSAPVLFDHDADGTLTGTGWLRSDDAWLVLDRNGNGSIDSGRELFGVDTLISGTAGTESAVYARNGFEALRSIDVNADGVFNSSDAAFSQVQLWRDFNQDGVSQSNELSSLASHNITGISLTPSNTVTNLGNGNTISGTATVTRGDGINTTAAGVGVSTVAANLDLVNNPFYREFSSPVILSSQALELPDMRGSGWVRDLREAMSLSTPQASELVAKVQQFAMATTHSAQMALLDEVIRAWADTNQTQAISGGSSRRFVLNGDAVTSAQMQSYIPLLEVFNGTTVEQIGIQAPTVSWENGTSVVTFNLFAEQVPSMLAAYDSLRRSVYSALVVQTRLKPYLDSIELMIDETGVRFSTIGIDLLAQQRATTDGFNALMDVIDLHKHGGEIIRDVGWNFEETFNKTIQHLAVTPDIQAILTNERLVWVGAGATAYTVAGAYAGYRVIGNELNNTLTGNAAGSELLYGGAGNDTLNAVGSSDVLDGGAGDDVLNANGNFYTTHIGGAGNDSITGSFYADTYQFNRGDGSDTINDNGSHSGMASYNDRLIFGSGIATSDIGARRVGNDLLITVAGQVGDQINVKHWFGSAYGEYRIEQVLFADGTVWSHDDLAQLALATTNQGTVGDDTISGTVYYSDRLVGGLGNDTLNAVGNSDVLDGGAGDDVLNANGNFYTTHIGGAGNDSITGSFYADTYQFNRGDGSDTINDNGSHSGMASYNDRLIFGSGIATSDIGARRVGNDLLITVAGQAGDQINVKHWFGSAYGEYRIEQVLFADGTVWSHDDLAQLALATTNQGTVGDDTISGTVYYSDRLVGGLGNDTLNAVGSSDVLDGGAGDDVLNANGNFYTTHIGGAGNDSITGSFYADTYQFNRGDGSDTINDNGSHSGMASYNDRLIFGSGIATSDIGARRVGNDLLITVAGQVGDQINVKHWFGSAYGEYRIEQVLFADGTVWSHDDLAQLALATTNQGTVGDDTISGTVYYSDRLVGGLGNDTLNAVGNSDVLDGGAGDDVLNANGNFYTTHIGGAGNDSITGSFYADTYQFNRGDGSDTINDNGSHSGMASYNDRLIFGSGIATSDIGARRVGNDLLITVAGQAGDQINVKHWFGSAYGEYRIEQVLFADGTVWSHDDLAQLALATTNQGTVGDDTISGTVYYSDRLVGGLGNDTLNAVGNSDVLDGGAGDDVLNANGNFYTTHIGGAGNDSITGSFYADTYQFNRGDGSDTINDNGPHSGAVSYNDRLIFGSGIATSDIGARRVGNDLLITVAGQAGDQINVKHWFAAAYGEHSLEQVLFADGTVWSPNDLIQLALTTTNQGTAGDDTISGTVYYSDRLVGGLGNDTLNAVGNSDVLDGGAGDDVLNANGNFYTTHIGGAGNDSITGSFYADTYQFNRGDGSDTINDNGPHSGAVSYNDRLIFGSGIATSDIGARRVGNDLLITVAGQAGDQINVKHWFAAAYGEHSLEQVLFADGTVWSPNDLIQLALTTTNQGTAGDDTISGTVYYSDRLVGGLGNDTLNAVGNSDVLDGGAGDDVLNANGNFYTTHIGGAGNDSITGSFYADTYQFNRGDGSDTINDNGPHSGAVSYNDRLIFGSGIATSDIGARRVGNDLLITVAGQAGDQINVKHWFAAAYGEHSLEQVLFADGTVWSPNDLIQLALTTTNQGTAGDDTISGTVYYSDRLVGGLGNDTLNAVGNSDVLDGGAGDDVLNANGNFYTTHIGGAGNDSITGSFYADTYQFNRGDGSDTINDNGPHSGAVSYNDRLIFGDGITDQELWFSRSGNDLHVQVLGDGGKVQVAGWYSGVNQHIEELQLFDGQKLLSSNVDNLVQAMAAFSPPPPGQAVLTPEQQSQLSTVIAANWA